MKSDAGEGDKGAPGAAERPEPLDSGSAFRDPLREEQRVPEHSAIDSKLRFDASGLIPAIAQDATSGAVLMHAYMNAEALRLTRETGFVHYYSRSRQRLWRKGETTGHVQRVREMRYDCDGDTLLLLIDQTGAACHTGQASCFYRTLQPAADPAAPSFDLLSRLDAALRTRKAERPAGSYTADLFTAGTDRILKKVGEEATEVLLAAKDGDRAHTVYELADLWFHTLVLMAQMDVRPAEVLAELTRRQGKRKADYA
jgi:phosphoribosyl-ATP pyrophosphohydrolase/phosphoribosyl-AMP cyclohydrolase